MDLAKTLIRSVVRAFYETRHALVIDALMIHSALPNEDLALVLGMQQKDLRKLCGKLREDRLLAVHSRQETREGMQRPIHRDYYYIDFHATIDAIKYRIWHLTQKVKDQYKPSEEKKDYFCPRCRSQWTQLEVLDHTSLMGEFLCHKCDHVLERYEVSAADRAGHERQSKLMAQLDSLLRLLRQIDNVHVPQNDFQTALSLSVPIQRDESINPSRRLEPVKPEPSKDARGFETAYNAPIEVSLVDAATTEQERLEAARKQELQNKLPEWHTRSTITGERTALGNKEAAHMASRAGGGSGAGVGLKAEDEDEESKKGADLSNAMVDEYFAKLREEKAREAQEEQEDDDDDDDGDEDDDEDDFEDVGIGGGGVSATGTTGVNTPSSSVAGGGTNNNVSSTSAALNGSSSSRNGGTGTSRVTKKEETGSDDSESAAGTSTMGTPARTTGGTSATAGTSGSGAAGGGGSGVIGGFDDDDDDDDDEDTDGHEGGSGRVRNASPAKKVKLDPSIVGTTKTEKVEKVEKVEEKEDADSDEDEEFEDAL